jgi:ABC-type uncharacterized transport system permease subunit
MKINRRNLLIQAAVSLPIGFAIGYYAISIGVWWAVALAVICGIASGLLVGALGFKIREAK